jgi:hypothetical protein
MLKTADEAHQTLGIDNQYSFQHTHRLQPVVVLRHHLVTPHKIRAGELPDRRSQLERLRLRLKLRTTQREQKPRQNGFPLWQARWDVDERCQVADEIALVRAQVAVSQELAERVGDRFARVDAEGHGDVLGGLDVVFGDDGDGDGGAVGDGAGRGDGDDARGGGGCQKG